MNIPLVVCVSGVDGVVFALSLSIGHKHGFNYKTHMNNNIFWRPSGCFLVSVAVYVFQNVAHSGEKRVSGAYSFKSL